MPKPWELPLYEFELPRRKIVVNVTRSCPTFAVPAPGVADVAAELKKKGQTKVLDFGAGKLRNAIYLLGKGFQVWAVEFKDCFQTPAGERCLTQAEGYKKFFLKKWPDEFLECDFDVDAVFLINVANVVPEEADRRRIVAECIKRLRSGGSFYWMSQYGEPYYKPAVTKRLRAPDGGWFYSLHKSYQTYYREFQIPEIMTYFDKARFQQPPRKIVAAHHRAFLFEKR